MDLLSLLKARDLHGSFNDVASASELHFKGVAAALTMVFSRSLHPQRYATYRKSCAPYFDHCLKWLDVNTPDNIADRLHSMLLKIEMPSAL